MNLSTELRRVYLFSSMTEAELARIEATTRAIDLSIGDVLFHHGDPCLSFYLLRTGAIKLYRLSPEGYEKVIEIIHPGETFAEAVVFMEREAGYPVTATAVQNSQLLQFDGPTFVSILRESSDTCFRLMAAMSQRLRWQINEIDRLTLHSATFRLVTYLLDEIQKKPNHSNELLLTAPKSVLASRLGIQPETFSRILGRLSGKNLIEVDRQSIKITDVAGLRGQLIESR